MARQRDRVEVEHQVGQHHADHAADELRGRPAPPPPGCRSSPSARSTSVTTGLNEADTGCSARISATSTAPVARLFSSSWSPVSCGTEPLGGDAGADDGHHQEGRADQLGDGPTREWGHAVTPPRSALRSARAAGAHAVVDPDAALAPVEQADLVEHLEVVADGRLREVEGVVQVADAGLLVGVRRDEGQQPQPHRIGQRLEQRRDPECLVGSEGLLEQRGAAGDLLGRE